MNENQSVLAYNVGDACRAVGVGRTTLYRLIAEGRIKALQLDGRTVIPAPSLRSFLAELPPAAIRSKATPDANEQAAAGGGDTPALQVTA